MLWAKSYTLLIVLYIGSLFFENYLLIYLENYRNASTFWPTYSTLGNKPERNNFKEQ